MASIQVFLQQLRNGMSRRVLVARAVLAILTASIVYLLLPRDAKAFVLSQPMSVRCRSERVISDDSCNAHSGTTGGVPNILNLVYILADPVDGTFPLQFSHYLSAYAGLHLWQPDIIYLHTNVKANSTAVHRARSGETGKWAQRFFEIPALVINTISVPTHAQNGVMINCIEHKSDFVRVQAMQDFGGVYIDFDVYTLKSLRSLRESGYGAVVGRQVNGEINSGTFLSEQGGLMISMWRQRMHEVYDGRWTTHSNEALTMISEKLAKESCEILILEPAAFAPVGWKWYNGERLFGDHFEASMLSFNQEGSLTAYPEDYEELTSPLTSWTLDWSCTFLLHAFSSKPRSGVTDNNISPKSIVERRSNFARALYPIVRIMYAQGLIDMYDLGIGVNNNG